jgi:hypothetical protein
LIHLHLLKIEKNDPKDRCATAGFSGKAFPEWGKEIIEKTKTNNQG